MCRTLVSALFHIRLLSPGFCLVSGPFAFSFVSTMRLIFVSYLLNVSDRCAGGSCDLEGAVSRLLSGTATLAVSMSAENFSVLLFGHALGLGDAQNYHLRMALKNLIGFASL